MTDIGSEIVIEVEDDGIGIAPEQVDEIVKSGVSSKGEGRGIGLFLVSETISTLNGQLTIEGISSGGSRFTVYLPRIPS
jgi:two-component system CitB family sensor kinase